MFSWAGLCTGKRRNIANMYYYFKISKAEWLSKMNSKIEKLEIWLVVYKKPLTQAVKRLLPACALFRCMSTFLRILCRMANIIQVQSKIKIPIVTSPITMLGKFDLLLRGLGGCVKKKNCWRHKLQWNVHNGKLTGASEVVGRKKRRVQSKNYCKGNNDDESSCGVVPA